MTVALLPMTQVTRVYTAKPPTAHQLIYLWKHCKHLLSVLSWINSAAGRAARPEKGVVSASSRRGRPLHRCQAQLGNIALRGTGIPYAKFGLGGGRIEGADMGA